MSAAGEAGSARPGAWRLLLNNRLAAAGLVLFALLLLVALAAPILPLQDPNATAAANRLAAPFSEGHLLGTDQVGRDILARLVWGLRVSLAVGLSASLLAGAVGSAIGLVAGFAGGRIDGLLMRSIDMLMAFPYILLALAIVAVLGPGLMNALYAIAVVNVPFFARNVRGITLGLARLLWYRLAMTSDPAPLLVHSTAFVLTIWYALVPGSLFSSPRQTGVRRLIIHCITETYYFFKHACDPVAACNRTSKCLQKSTLGEGLCQNF